jgi:hypothetical protein
LAGKGIAGQRSEARETWYWLQYLKEYEPDTIIDLLDATAIDAAVARAKGYFQQEASAEDAARLERAKQLHREKEGPEGWFLWSVGGVMCPCTMSALTELGATPEETARWIAELEEKDQYHPRLNPFGKGREKWEIDHLPGVMLDGCFLAFQMKGATSGLQALGRRTGAQAVVAPTGPTVANTTRGWRVGDPINNLTSTGRVPSWSAVRQRFWKNEAHFNPGNYSEANLARMRQGLAPQRINRTTGQVESMELHHTPPQRDGGLFDVQPVWPDQHRRIDPFRR